MHGVLIEMSLNSVSPMQYGQNESACKAAMLEAVSQVLELISATETVYVTVPANSVSAIGKHIRHIVDHLWAYREGLAVGTINYNLRHRDTELERDARIAFAALTDFSRWLEKEKINDVDVFIECEVSISSELSAKLQSKCLRELVFLISHTYHHLAYANLVAKLMNVKTPDHIGVAPATATFMRDCDESKKLSQA